ncbi:alkaline-phosphatase-like protein [Hyaloraphidium curvatum]|nr:alkaline-phosphatase-like protein [Hyaloraphidium curvatum]
MRGHVALLAALLKLLLLLAGPADAEKRRPSIIVYVVDDLDVHMGSLESMPHVRARLLEKGTRWNNAVVTTALCCPTRSTFLTGLLAHNTNYTSTMEPYGGYEPFLTKGLTKDYLPIWLRDAGYKTYFVGKLVNGVTTANYMRPLEGWDVFDVMLLPYLYDYLNPVFSRNGNPPKHYRGQYQTDVITKKTLDILASTPADRPFFLYVAPGAAHSTYKFPQVRSALANRDPALPYEALGLGWTYPIPAERHAHLFNDSKVPREPWFDPEVFEGKPSWHAHLKRKTPYELEEMDRWHRARLRTLQAVDEGIEHLFLALERMGRLDDTYFLFLSDNGYHLGQLRMNVGKSSPYETDVRIPFVVRGPGVGKGERKKDVVTAADVAPTVLRMAGLEGKPWFDGQPIDLSGTGEGTKREGFLVEYWDLAADEGFQNVYRNNMYKSIRIVSDEHNLYFAVWCTNETEFYDLRKDPWQLSNAIGTANPRLVSRLEALVKTMKECKGAGCREPWGVLHPDGSVKSLTDALDPVGCKATASKEVIG